MNDQEIKASELIVQAKKEAFQELIDLLDRSLEQSGEDFLDVDDIKEAAKYLMGTYIAHHADDISTN
jgi:hypothetical protein